MQTVRDHHDVKENSAAKLTVHAHTHHTANVMYKPASITN